MRKKIIFLSFLTFLCIIFNPNKVFAKTTEEQIDDLCTKISQDLEIDKEEVNMILSLSNSKILYIDQMPNIYNELTATNFDDPIVIEGVDIEYIKYDNVKCQDDTITRPNSKYLPDALYSVVFEINEIKKTREKCNRGSYSATFDALNNDVKKALMFDEAVLLYLGVKEKDVNKLIIAYEKTLFDKEKHENIVEKNENNVYNIKKKYVPIFNEIGIKKDYELKALAKLLSFDSKLAKENSIESLKEEFVVPYELNKTTRENMLLAMFSLAGKVRYVWGGGHSGASHIDGINPVWIRFNNLYPTEQYTKTYNKAKREWIQTENPGYGCCIKTSGSWCPVHGYKSGECYGGAVYSLDEYVNSRADVFDSTELLDEKYREMLSEVDYSNGISVHTLDGLDCSGYASWVYNQITDKYQVNSAARYFTRQSAIKEIKIGEELLPGDIFSWTTHIVLVVGKSAEKSKAYVTIEQTPNVLRFGVIYYSGAKADDITQAKKIAEEANLLIAGTDEPVRAYCINSVGFYTVTYDKKGRVVDGEDLEQHGGVNNVRRVASEDTSSSESLSQIPSEDGEVDPPTQDDEEEQKRQEEEEQKRQEEEQKRKEEEQKRQEEEERKRQEEEQKRKEEERKKQEQEEKERKEQEEKEKREEEEKEERKKNSGIDWLIEKDTIKVNKSKRLEIKLYGDGDGVISWNSKNEDVATVDSSGYVKGVGVGNVDIIATYNGKSATCHLTVEENEDDDDYCDADEEYIGKTKKGYKKVKKQYISIGRFKDSFEDEDEIIKKYNKSIKEMNAQEIIQYIACKLPISYITGYDKYNGELFDKKMIFNQGKK